MYVCIYYIYIEEDMICVQLAFHELHLQPDRAGKTKDKTKNSTGWCFSCGNIENHKYNEREFSPINRRTSLCTKMCLCLCLSLIAANCR